MSEPEIAVAGLDVGTECVKAIVLKDGRTIAGRAVVPTRGYFQERGHEALRLALDEAQLAEADLAELCVTGFGRQSVTTATTTMGEAACHALGAFHYFSEPMTVVDIGGREPQVIHVNGSGRPTEIYTVRRCAIGIGTFLMYAARHLDVHPTQLQELAATVESPAAVGSYCSVFAGSEILDRLREGISREEVALGCVHSIAERILEIGGFQAPLKITGGVVEYFPGVMKVLAERTGLAAAAIPEPIMVASLGAALKAWQISQGNPADS